MMKRLLFAMLMLPIIAIALLTGCAVHPAGWKLVWTEDFKGKNIDDRVWSRIPKGGSDWDDMMSLRSDLAYVEDGQLVLLGKVNDHSGDDATPFVTGGIWSHQKKSFRMARFEIRARFNKVQGFWPALWLMPDTIMPSPDYAEIDIMEHVNFEAAAHQTVHSHYTLHIKEDNKPQQSATTEIKTDEWNTYATEIHPDSICFFINGKKTMTYPRIADKPYQFPWPNYPFYIILSNQLGGNWVGPVSEPQQLPSELRVDWIKVYEKKSNSTTPDHAQANQQEDLDDKYATELVKAGTEAPDFTMKTPDGKSVQLSQFLRPSDGKRAQGKTVVLDFWASWCPDCRKEAPEVVRMYEAYKKYGIEFIGISMDTDVEAWKKAIDKYGITYTQVSELKSFKETDIAKAYGVKWIPSMVVVGPDGKVKLSTVMSSKVDNYLKELTKKHPTRTK